MRLWVYITERQYQVMCMKIRKIVGMTLSLIISNRIFGSSRGGSSECHGAKQSMILRLLTSAGSYATLCFPKKQIRRAEKVIIQNGQSSQRNREQKIIRTSDLLRGSDYSSMVTVNKIGVNL